ncbi:MAG: PDR/VanB family oxidoreductase [Rubrivivax sp.]
MDTTTPPLQLQVAEVQALNPLITRLRLLAAAGGTLPAYSAGAHLQVQVLLPDGSAAWRHYSLVDFAGDAAAPQAYDIAVRREDAGRGGSRHMHGLQPGTRLQVLPPRNDFPLQPGSSPVLLLAGGIGITPLLTMAAQCRRQGRPVRLVYAGRSRALMAFVPELQQLLGSGLQLHADDEAGAPLDVGALLAGCAADETVHVCGPQPLLDAVLAAAKARSWPAARVRFELFTAPAAEAGDRGFEVVLSSSGRTLQVAADQTLLQALIAAGCDPMFDCQRGECGVCAVPVLDGEIEHRDHVLSAREKAANNVIQVCVSRAKGARLVLDL